MADRGGIESDPVLVGVDGSSESDRALRWAAREAALRDAGLHIVHSWLWPLFRVPLGGSPLAPEGAGLQAEAERVLGDAETLARSVAPDASIETTLAVGEPATELIRRAPGAQVVVVGNRGLGGFTGLLLGSTGIALSAHSPCPVVIVRGTEPSRAPVVVGVGPGPEAEALVRRAAREAAMRGVELVAIHCWRPGVHLTSLTATSVEQVRAAARQAGRALLDKVVAPVGVEFDQVAIETRLGDREPAAELVDASRGAQLLLVGTRGRGPVQGMLLGSTAHAAIHHAACPVLVER